MKQLYAYTSIFLCLLLSCQQSSKEIVENYSANYAIDNLSVSDSTYTHINNLLNVDSYTVLSNKIPLGKVERVIISNNRIYILDSEPKIVCYNFDGTIRFSISSRGKGPGEYTKIIDFSIDENRDKVIIYDSVLRRQLFYNSTDGKFDFSEKIEFDPHAIASFDGTNYYYNPYRYNYPRDKELHYSLFTSRDNAKIQERFFPHDPVISNYMFGYSGEAPFFYGTSELLFCRRFDNTIYSLKRDSLIALFQIRLPKEVPYSYIKDRPKPIDLIKSNYSFGLSDIYRVNNILYFTFTFKGNLISCFYNLKLHKTIYCGRRIWPVPTKELPVYYPIRGVFRSKFVSLVSPSTIIEMRKQNKQVFPQSMLNITEMDNPIVVFYSVKNEKASL